MKYLSTGILLFLGISMAITAQRANIHGQVLSAEHNQSLPGAHLILTVTGSESQPVERQTISSADGSYRFQDLPAGEARLQVSFVGYEPQRVVQEIRAGENRIDLVLIPRQVSLAQIVVTSLRKEKPLRESAMPFAVIREEEIEGLAGPTLSDMVTAQPGINLVRDGIWATSLNIRGLGENRVIAMIDGNRLETATDLAAALSMIDPSDVEQVEVIKGAASALYGSGSLGGVVNIITRKAHYADGFYLNGKIDGGYQTVNNLQSGRLQVMTGNRKWHANLSGNLRGAGDTETPLGEMPNSQFRDRSLVGDLALKLGQKLEFQAGYQHIYARDVGIPGGLAFPSSAEATYTRALRDLLYARLEGQPGHSLRKWSLNIFAQDILRDVLVYPNAPPVVSPTQIVTAQSFTPAGTHRTRGISFQTEWAPFARHSLVAGVDLWSRHLFTSREKSIQIELLDAQGDVTAVNQMVRGEVPIPDSRFTSSGFFFHDEVRLPGNRVLLQLGGRLDGIFVQNEEARDPLFLIVNGNRNDSPPNQRITFPEGREQDLSWSLNAGLVYHLASSSDLTFSLARAYRSASLEERYKYIDLGSKVRVGDPDLGPETGWSADLGWRTWTPSLELGINAYINRIDGLITEVAGEYIYQVYTGPDTWITDTLPALVNTNINRGLLTGFDLSGKWIPGSRVFLGGSAGFTLGRDLDSGDPLPLIPPFNGRLFLGYKFHGIGQARLESVFAADQDRVAAGETRTPGYMVYHFYFQTVEARLGPAGLRVFTGVENITDRAYRNHLSTNRGTVDVEPGRNLFLKLSLSF